MTCILAVESLAWLKDEEDVLDIIKERYGGEKITEKRWGGN
jgi:hypothetical protein